MPVDATLLAAVQKVKVTRPSITAAQNSVVCWVRLHSKVAETYGIKDVDLNTSVGSMLLQTLEAQGMDVDWYERLPTGSLANSEDASANQKAAAYIWKVSRRPGARMKPLSERPQVAPPDEAAIVRHHGRPPRVSFPLLLKLAAQRRRRAFSWAGNEIVTPAPVALCERACVVDFVEKKLRCACGKRLRFAKAAPRGREDSRASRIAGRDARS